MPNSKPPIDYVKEKFKRFLFIGKLLKATTILALDSNILINYFLENKKKEIEKELNKIKFNELAIDSEDLLSGINSFLQDKRKKSKYLVFKNREIIKELKKLDYPYVEDNKIELRILNEEDLETLSSLLSAVLVKLLSNKTGKKVNIISESEISTLAIYYKEYENLKNNIKESLVNCRIENNRRKFLPKQEIYEKDQDAVVIVNLFLYFRVMGKYKGKIIFMTSDSDFQCKEIQNKIRELTDILVHYIRI